MTESLLTTSNDGIDWASECLHRPVSKTMVSKVSYHNVINYLDRTIT